MNPDAPVLPIDLANSTLVAQEALSGTESI